MAASKIEWTAPACPSCGRCCEAESEEQANERYGYCRWCWAHKATWDALRGAISTLRAIEGSLSEPRTDDEFAVAAELRRVIELYERASGWPVRP